MTTLKAGCILIDKQNKKIGLIYRDRQRDFTFPKGHLEKGETLEECAIRETAEETKRDCEIIDHNPIMNIYKFRHKSGKIENCECSMYLAIDKGKSDNTSLDTHELIWVDYEEVYDKLTYTNLKALWQKVYNRIKSIK